MKKTVLVLLVTLFSTVFVVSCLKNDDDVQCTSYTLEQDKHIIDSFMNKKGYTLTYNTDTGVYSGIITPGQGSMPTADSIVYFKFVGTLMDGTIVDSASTTATSTQPLKNYYASTWPFVPLFAYFALPKLKEGGTMRIIIPSSRNAGCYSYQTPLGKTVPANSQIIYDVTLTDVKKP